MSSRAFSRPPAMRPFSSLQGAHSPMPDLRKRYPVTVFAGPNTRGDLMLLFTDDAIEQNENEMATELARSLESLRDAGVPEEHLQLRWAAYLERRRVYLDAYLKQRNAALPLAQFHEYVLVLPLLKDWQRITDAVYERPVTFDALTDTDTRAAVLEERINRRAARYQDLLLKNNGLETPNGKVLSPEEIDAIDPVIAHPLGVWLAKLTDASPLRKMLILPHS